MPYQNISAEINEESMSQLTQKIKEIGSSLPFLVNLTPKEIKKLFILGDRSLPFVEEALRYAGDNTELFPSYLKYEEFKKDFYLFRNLKVLLGLIKPLTEKLNDTYMAVGSEAFSAARDFYYAVKRAAESGVPGCDTIAQDLGRRFAWASGKQEDKENKEEEPESSQEG
jgi:hypothetical protein